MPLAYREWHAIAVCPFGRERRDHTPQATALLNEAWLRAQISAEVEAATPQQYIDLGEALESKG